MNLGIFEDFSLMQRGKVQLHPGRLTWNLQITHLERKMIFQTSIIMVHVNLPGCKFPFLGLSFEVRKGLIGKCSS